jgi:hypothetical protein
MVRVKSIATPWQRIALDHLEQAVKGYRLSEAPFVALPEDVPTITINKLMERDYIVRSKLTGAATYKITGRGIKLQEQIAAQEAASAQIGRSTCKTPDCDSPVYIAGGGKRYTVCQTCYQAQARQRYAEGKGLPDPNKLCSKCRRARRHITKAGHVHCYCKECLYTVARSYRDAYQAAFKEAVARGEQLICKKRGCSRPITTFQNGQRASRYCRECQRGEWRQYIRNYKARKKRARYAALMKKS